MKRRAVVSLSALLILTLQPGQTQRTTQADSFLARKERWAIKTGADPAARAIPTAHSKPTKVADLIRLRRPSELPTDATTRAAQTTRYSEAEHTTYTIDADILRYKLEKDDHDFHVVIRDHDDTRAEDPPVESGQRRTMIVEFPDPGVVVTSSPWRAAIERARRTFTDRLQPTGRFTRHIIHARITGVGYFDFLHGQSGVAPNGIELHPVLSVELLEEGQDSKPPTVIARSRTPRSQNSPPTASGQVWVNLSSGAYWRPGTRYYGKTKRGKYMDETAAKDAGYHAAGGQ